MRVSLVCLYMHTLRVLSLLPYNFFKLMASSSISMSLLFATLLLTAVAESQRCDVTSIRVQQRNTGRRAGYDPVFEVEVKNMCRCAVSNVFLRSEGFASSTAVDPKLFRRHGGDYLVADGRGIPSSLSVKFRYAWDRAFTMSPASLQVNCWR